MSKKIESIVVDTLTAIQINQYLTAASKPDFDKWTDFGKDIYTFIINLQRLGFELVLVVGEPGTGKTTGMKTLNPDQTIWYNVDSKLPPFKGGRKAYGTFKNPNKNQMVPTTYSEIITHIKSLGRDSFGEMPVAFLTAHVENFKQGREQKSRLKTLGNMASKFAIEGTVNTVLYSTVDTSEGAPKFLLETQNNGFNTARSYEGMLEALIPNDYQMILEAIQNY